ncbi:hypothetical protein CLOP_g547 [Closterium sp. NIES-67]|nr:hypothetical protein CLOP_g547 [Closterium sp. NIES-67]
MHIRTRYTHLHIKAQRPPPHLHTVQRDGLVRLENLVICTILAIHTLPLHAPANRGSPALGGGSFLCKRGLHCSTLV